MTMRRAAPQGTIWVSGVGAVPGTREMGFGVLLLWRHESHCIAQHVELDSSGPFLVSAS